MNVPRTVQPSVDVVSLEGLYPIEGAGSSSSSTTASQLAMQNVVQLLGDATDTEFQSKTKRERSDTGTQNSDIERSDTGTQNSQIDKADLRVLSRGCGEAGVRSNWEGGKALIRDGGKACWRITAITTGSSAVAVTSRLSFQWRSARAAVTAFIDPRLRIVSPAFVW